MMPMPNITDIIDFETGRMPPQNVPAFIQPMIDSGMVGRLQGKYSKMADDLVRAGFCTPVVYEVTEEEAFEEDAHEERIAHGQFGVGA